MATKQAAFQKWAGEFMKAYPTTAVPTSAKFPYLTYELSVGAWDEGEQLCQMNVYMQTESEAEINRVIDEIAQSVGLGGFSLKCDSGLIWIKRGSPFCNPIDDEPGIKRRLVNLSVEFMTLY